MTCAICDDMAGPEGSCAKGDKSDKDKHCLDRNTESNWLVARVGGGEGEGG